MAIGNVIYFFVDGFYSLWFCKNVQWVLYLFCWSWRFACAIRLYHIYHVLRLKMGLINPNKLGNPNLSPKQISYAAQDTEYLFEIKDKLIKMLIREKRMDLFKKCMKVIPVMVDMEISGYKLSTFEH